MIEISEILKKFEKDELYSFLAGIAVGGFYFIFYCSRLYYSRLPSFNTFLPLNTVFLIVLLISVYILSSAAIYVIAIITTTLFTTILGGFIKIILGSKTEFGSMDDQKQLLIIAHILSLTSASFLLLTPGILFLNLVFHSSSCVLRALFIFLAHLSFFIFLTCLIFFFYFIFLAVNQALIKQQKDLIPIIIKKIRH